MDKNIQGPIVQVATAQPIVLGGMLEQEIRHIAIIPGGLAVIP